MGCNERMNDVTGIAASASLREYMRIIFRQKAVIVLSVITVTTMVFLGLKLKIPRYEAQVKMLISAEKLVQAPNYRDLVEGPNVQESLTQAEIVKSTPVLERVVRVLKLDQRSPDYEKKYASSLKNKLIDLKNNMRQKRKKTDSSLDQDYVVFQKALDDLRSRIDVEAIHGTKMFTIRVTALDPVEAAATANIVSRSYILYDLEQQLADLSLKYAAKHPLVLQLKESFAKMMKSLNGDRLSNVEAIGPATVKVIEQAGVPIKAKGVSKVAMLVLAFVMSLFIGTMFAFALEYTDPTYKSVREIENKLELDLLGSIPKRKLGEKLLLEPKAKKTVYHHFYQDLVDQLYLVLKEQKLTSVMVTSTASTGTSAIVANIGALLSQKPGHDVLMVDANLRQPSLHKVMQIENEVGFADIGEGRNALSEVTQTVKDQYQILTAGKVTHNPVALFNETETVALHKTARKKYTTILYDCPNMMRYKESSVLAQHVDATVVIINEGQTRRHVLEAALQSFNKESTNIIGVVCNNRSFPVPKLLYDRI